MSDAQVQAAQKATSTKDAGPTSTPGTSKSKPDTYKEWPMDTDADQATQYNHFKELGTKYFQQKPSPTYLQNCTTWKLTRKT